jgi:hypothetical protein
MSLFQLDMIALVQTVSRGPVAADSNDSPRANIGSQTLLDLHPMPH